MLFFANATGKRYSELQRCHAMLRLGCKDFWTAAHKLMLESWLVDKLVATIPFEVDYGQ